MISLAACIATKSIIIAAAELSAEEHFKEISAIPKQVMTYQQVQAAEDIVDAIMHNYPDKVASIYKDFFANDLTLSPDREKIEGQRVLAQSLVNAVKGSLILFGDVSLNFLRNDAGHRFFGVIPNTLLMIHQPILEEFGQEVVQQIARDLPAQDILNLLITSKEAKQFVEPILKKRDLGSYWAALISKFEPIVLRSHARKINVVIFSHDGKTLASGSDDHKIILWDTATGKRLKELIGHSGAITSLDFSPDDSTIVSAGTDGTIRLWNVETGHEYEQLIGINNHFNLAVFSHDGRCLAYTATDDLPVCKIRNLATNEEKFKLYLYDPMKITFSSDDKVLVILDLRGWGPELILWDFQNHSTPRLETSIPQGSHINSVRSGNLSGPYAVTFSNDLKYLAAGCNNNLVIWNIEKEKGWWFQGTDMHFNAIAYSPEGYLLAETDKDVAIVSGATVGKKLTHIVTVKRNIMGTAVCFSPDGKTIAVGFANGAIELLRQ